MIIDRITPHDGSNEACPECEEQIDACVCSPEGMEQKPDTEWQTISDQIDYWAEMDREYWCRRKEKEYEIYLNRKLNK